MPATISGRLGLLMLAVALPLLVGALVIAALAWHDGTMAREERLPARAQAAARSIDAEIAGRRIALESFAAARGPLADAELVVTDAAARRLAEALGAQVNVLDRGLGLLVDTAQPFGTPLGSTPAVAEGLWAVETGRTRLSNGPTGTTTDAPPMLLVPVMNDGRVAGVLSVSLSADRMAAALAPRRGVLFDNRWRPVAMHGGGPANLPDWTVLAAAPRGVPLAGTAGHGGSVAYAVANLAEAPDWRLVTWDDAGLAHDPAASLLPWVLLCMAVTLATALLARGRTLAALRQPVTALERHARATAEALRADAPRPAPPRIGAPAEYAALGAALAEAEDAAAATEARLRALAEAGAIVLWRADSAGGWLEAAGWAGLTGQTAPAFRGAGWIEMLHPDDRAPTLAEWGRSLVARRQIGVEFRMRTADDAAGWRWVRATGVPVSDASGRLQEWVGAIHDVGEARGSDAARLVNDSQVRQTVAELRGVYDTVPVGLSLVDPSLRFVNVNARFAAIGGLAPEAHVGRHPHEVMPESLARPIEDAQRRVFETGRPVLDVTCSGAAAGTTQQLRHWLASCHPVKDAEGTVTGVSAVLQEVTERVRAEQSRELMVTELNHRVKNTLATVQYLASQSIRGARGVTAGMGREFVGRLQALMRAHDLLADLGWQEADLARVVRTGLAPGLDAGRAIRFGGSGRIQVSAGQTQAIVLALHELASNALRHGALSQPGGEVDIAWALGDDGVATLDWRESGGPPVEAPQADQRGFGMRLLERGLVHDLGPGASVQVQFAPGGVSVAMRFRSAVPALQPATA